MKTFSAFAALALCVAVSATAQTNLYPQIPATDAKKHIGETVTVYGTICKMSGRIIDVDGYYENAPLTIIAQFDIDYSQLKNIVGKKIFVTGVIRNDTKKLGIHPIIYAEWDKTLVEGLEEIKPTASSKLTFSESDFSDQPASGVKPTKMKASAFLDAPDAPKKKSLLDQVYDQKPATDSASLENTVFSIICTIVLAAVVFSIAWAMKLKQRAQTLIKQIRNALLNYRRLIKELSEINPAILGGIIAKLITAVLLFAAAGRHDYDYYTLLRCVGCGVAAFTAFQAMQDKKGWLFVFVILAVILNPIAPLHLKRDTWAFVDATAAVLLLASIVIIEGKSMSKSLRRFLFLHLRLLALLGIVVCYILFQNVPIKFGKQPKEPFDFSNADFSFDPDKFRFDPDRLRKKR